VGERLCRASSPASLGEADADRGLRLADAHLVEHRLVDAGRRETCAPSDAASASGPRSTKHRRGRPIARRRRRRVATGERTPACRDDVVELELQARAAACRRAMDRAAHRSPASAAEAAKCVAVPLLRRPLDRPPSTRQAAAA
jgi:hypothetical protein